MKQKKVVVLGPPPGERDGVGNGAVAGTAALVEQPYRGRSIEHKAQMKRRHVMIALMALLFLLPSIVGFLVYSVAPIVFGLYISFTKYVGFGTPEFTGWTNYQILLHDQAFWHSLITTFFLTIFTVPIGILVSLALALLLNEDLPLRGLFRVGFFLPSAVPWVATALLFRDMFAIQGGLVNQVLQLLHMPTQDWLAATDTNLLGPQFWLIVIVSIWKGYGFNMLIYLAGLQGIPPELYEAAMIDGANHWQRFLNITVPLLAPVTLFVTITSIIGSLQTFTPVYLLGSSAGVNGDTAGGVQTVSVYAYNTAFAANYYGYGSAILWGLFVIMFVFTLIQFRIFMRGKLRGEALV